MEEFDLSELFRFLKTKVVGIIFFSLLCGILGFVYMYFVLVPMYKSSTTIILVNNSSNSTTIQSDISLNRNLVTTYSEFVKSRKVIEKVITDLNLTKSYEDLIKNIEVSSVNNTEIIRISVSDEDAVNARNITKKLADVFESEIKNYYTIENVKILDEASLPSVPYNISYIKQGILYFLIGTFISIVIYGIEFYFDTKVKSPEQIEQRLNLVILGRIPEEKRGK